MVQTAERGAYPEVMCATEDGLEERALYGPTGRLEMVGPVGKGTLESYAVEKGVTSKLWDVSEDTTGFTWEFAEACCGCRPVGSPAQEDMPLNLTRG